MERPTGPRTPRSHRHDARLDLRMLSAEIAAGAGQLDIQAEAVGVGQTEMLHLEGRREQRREGRLPAEGLEGFRLDQGGAFQEGPEIRGDFRAAPER